MPCQAARTSPTGTVAGYGRNRSPPSPVARICEPRGRARRGSFSHLCPCVFNKISVCSVGLISSVLKPRFLHLLSFCVVYKYLRTHVSKYALHRRTVRSLSKPMITRNPPQLNCTVNCLFNEDLHSVVSSEIRHLHAKPSPTSKPMTLHLDQRKPNLFPLASLAAAGRCVT